HTMWIHVFSLTFATAAVNMPHWLINLRNTRRRAHSQTGRFDRKSAPGNIKLPHWQRLAGGFCKCPAREEAAHSR
ncbi:hypothetical protein JI435_005560, partial [Parastagonospora nodorum SN15]